MNCVTCGADLASPGARFCSECGAAAQTEETVEAPIAAPVTMPPSPARISDEQWQYITWGAIAVAAVASVAIAAVVFGILSGGDGIEESVAVTTTQAVSAPTGKASVPIEVPVTEPILIESPRIGPSTRYYQSGTVVGVRVTMDECERNEGMLRASGSLRNDSALGQTLTYALTLDLERSRLGTRLARLDTVVERLGPGEVATWSVETPSTKVVTMTCDIATLMVAPPSAP